MAEIPPSRRHKRLTRWFGLVVGLGFGCSVGFVELFGTYTAFEIPTLTETIGLLLLFLFWNIIAFTLIIYPNIDAFTIADPLSDLPLTVLYIVISAALLAIDTTLFSLQGFTWLTTTASANQALISLIFSGLLVLLYYDQHRTQRQQVQLMRQQTELERRQNSWREEQERPRLRIDEWHFHKGDQPLTTADGTKIRTELLASYLTGSISQDRLGVFIGTLSNLGDTRARSLYLHIEVLVRSDDLPGTYYHLNGSFAVVRVNLLHLGDRARDQYLKRDSASVDANSTIDVIGSAVVLPLGESGSGIDDLGELIRRLPFSVENVVLRASIHYEGPIETSHREPVAAVRLPADEVGSLATAFTTEHQVGFHGVPTVGAEESMEFFEEEFADINSFEGGVHVSYEFQDS